MKSLQRLLIAVAGGAVVLASHACAPAEDADTDTTLASVLHADSLHVDSVLAQAAKKSRTGQAAGDVALVGDSAATDSSSAIWLSDENVLSLLSAMAGKQVAAANLALQAWRSDTVRTLATGVAHDNAALQHAVDSLAQALHMTPSAPAVTDTILAAMQAQIDSMGPRVHGSLDRAYLALEPALASQMAATVNALSAVASSPDVQALLGRAATQLGVETANARTLNIAFTAADSTAAADSLAKLSARRHGR